MPMATQSNGNCWNVPPALDQMHADGFEEATSRNERIEAAIAAGSASELQEASGELEELLFFIEGQH